MTQISREWCADIFEMRHEKWHQIQKLKRQRQKIYLTYFDLFPYNSINKEDPLRTITMLQFYASWWTFLHLRYPCWKRISLTPYPRNPWSWAMNLWSLRIYAWDQFLCAISCTNFNFFQQSSSVTYVNYILGEVRCCLQCEMQIHIGGRDRFVSFLGLPWFWLLRQDDWWFVWDLQVQEV